MSRIQFTPDLLPSDVTGVSIYNQASRSFEFRPGAVFANIVIGDEINRASAKTQSALLECMEEHQVTVDGKSYRLDEPFMVVATQNPIEMEGTYPLPEAQRDRFMARISMGYPDKESEMEMLETHQATSPLTRVTAVVTAADVAAMIATVQQVYVSQSIKEYTVVAGTGHAGKRVAPARCQPPVHAPAAPGGQGHRCAGRAGTSCCRTTSSASPKRCWRTGSSWTARRPARARRRRASSGPSWPRSRSPRRWARRRSINGRQSWPAQAMAAAPSPSCRTALGGGPAVALMDRFPGHIFSTRGWGLLGAGAVFLLAAQVMGRRDLLALAILLMVLPLLALAGTRVLKPRFQVYREFNPSTVETAAPPRCGWPSPGPGPAPATPSWKSICRPRFGESPVFRFPARSAAGGASRYEYHLRSGKRGQFRIGPVTAEFSDPFGLSLHRHAIDDGDILTVTPAAVDLPVTGLAGARGHDGVTATRLRANPSDDDVMTREYRHGDPMRRVHWAATARHGELMVRQEESVTTPEATIILDQRLAAFPQQRLLAVPLPPASRMRTAMSSTPTTAFEWAVTAAMSIGAHLSERNYALRFLDAAGEPAFLHSPSAPEPETEEYTGAAGLQSVAESLAAIQLSGNLHTPQGTTGGLPARNTRRRWRPARRPSTTG